MRTLWIAVLAQALMLAAPAASPTPTGFPFADEDLNYAVTFPSGISLGEVHTHAKHSGANWSFDMTIDAGVPGYIVKDTFRGATAGDLCTASFERDSSHGSRNTKEKTTVDRDRSLATRTTLAKDAGKSEFPVPMCVKDALTYMYFARREMGQGRVPGPQQIVYSGLVSIRADYDGPATITVNEKPVQTDKLTCRIKAGGSEYPVDIFFARDAARTPLRISAPLAMGKFSMELLR